MQIFLVKINVVFNRREHREKKRRERRGFFPLRSLCKSLRPLGLKIDNQKCYCHYLLLLLIPPFHPLAFVFGAAAVFAGFYFAVAEVVGKRKAGAACLTFLFDQEVIGLVVGVKVVTPGVEYVGHCKFDVQFFLVE